VSSRTVFFLTAMGLFVALILLLATYFVVQSLRRRRRWEATVARLTWVDRDRIALIALDLVDEFGRPKAANSAGRMEPSEIWELLGGLEGLTALERNSDLLIDLAFYLQQWYPEAVVIAERLRMDARQLKWHIARLNGAAANGNLQVSFPFYAQRAAVCYYLIIRRIFLLGESGNFPILSDLERAL
jgi:hypothetical protein